MDLFTTEEKSFPKERNKEKKSDKEKYILFHH